MQLRSPSGSYPVRIIQAAIAEAGYTIVIDGHLGVQTITSFSQLSPEYLVPLLKASVAMDVNIAAPVAVEIVDLYIDRIYVMHAKYLALLLPLENHILSLKAKDHYVIDILGTHQGLGQFDQPTWESISKLPFSSSREVEASIDSIVALYLANRKSFRLHFKGIFTDEIAYLYHNQGAPSAYMFLVNNELVYPKQSKEALELFYKIDKTSIVSKK